MNGYPHFGKEFGMLERGEKQIAYFGRPKIGVMTFAYHGTERTLFYRKGSEHFVRKFVRAFSMHERGLIKASTAHARCGLLLGYNKDEVRSFLHRNENLR
jgi:hypothetical protein